MARELVLCILVAVDDKIQTAQFIIVARLLRNTETRLGERRKIVVPKMKKSIRATGYRSVAVEACGQGDE
jgi:hypothetical protein